MAKWPRRAMVIGMDAPIPGRILTYVQQGELPHLARLIANGVWADHCLVPYPTITPTNWTTIATGAWPGTHGVTDFNFHRPGDPLDSICAAFDSRMCQAEHIWTAAERAGKHSIVINYPVSWPPTLRSGYQLAGAGVGPNEWRSDRPGVPTVFALCGEQAFSTEEYPLARQIEFGPSAAWRNAPAAGPGLAADLPLTFRNSAGRMRPVTWHALVCNQAGRGYDRLYLSLTPDAAQAFAVLEPGRWSPVIVHEFESEDGSRRRGAFRCKLVELRPDARRFRLFVTQVAALDGWAYPESLAGEIRSELGLPVSSHESMAYRLGWIDLPTYLEHMEILDVWLRDAASYLVASKEWDLFYMHTHTLDRFYHDAATDMEPLTARDQAAVARYQEAELYAYRTFDETVGRLVELAGDETLVVIVSDHGAKATGRRISPGQILVDAGLTTYRQGADGRPEVDWSRTEAIVQRSSYVYVNLKGRDPDGIVEPGVEYERVRDRIVAALCDWTDPETGKKPITLALRREDARVLGLYGDRIGDVVFACHGDFGGQHGMFLPTTEYGLGQVKGLLVMAGPGIKRGERLSRTVWLTDLVPTICHLVGLPMPAHAEGGVIYQAMENPDGRLEELQQLRENYERVKGAIEAERNLTHTYNMQPGETS